MNSSKMSSDYLVTALRCSDISVITRTLAHSDAPIEFCGDDFVVHCDDGDVRLYSYSSLFGGFEKLSYGLVAEFRKMIKSEEKSSKVNCEEQPSRVNSVDDFDIFTM